MQAFDLEPPHGHEKFARVWAFFETVSPPSRVVAVLEALVEEQVLRRRDASLIENKLLARVNRDGQWTC